MSLPHVPIRQSADESLQRCRAEQEGILSREDVVAGEAPAWLVTLGLEDWEAEKRLICLEEERLP